MPSPTLRRDLVDARPAEPGELLADEYNLHAQTTMDAYDAAEAALARETFTPAEKSKLAGVAPNATANATNAELRDRGTHTGEQPPNSITGLAEFIRDTMAAALVQGVNITITTDDAADTTTITATGGTGTGDPESIRDTIGAALATVGAASWSVNDAADTITLIVTATQNDTDANLRDRSTHTGVQPKSSITGLQTDLDSLDSRLDAVEIAGPGGGGVVPFRTNIGNGSPGPYTVTHGRNTRDFIPAIYRNSGHIDNDGNGAQVMIPVLPINLTQCLVDTPETWALDQLRLLLWPLPGDDTTAPATSVVALVTNTASDISVSATAGGASYEWLRDGAIIARTAGNTYTHTGLTAGSSYSMAVRIYDLIGNSLLSSTVSMSTTSAADTTPPTAPTAAFVSKTQTTVTISATGGTDAVGVTGYHHYRNGVKITGTPQAAGNYQHVGLVANTSYSFAASAVDAAGNEGPLSSPAIPITTDPIPSTNPVAVITDSAGSVNTAGTATGSDSLVIPGGHTNVTAYCAIWISHSTSDTNPDTFDSSSLVDSTGEAWTFVEAETNGQFTANQFGTLAIYKRANASAATHNVTFTFTDASMGTIALVRMHMIALENVGGNGTPVIGKNTTGAISVTVAVAEGNYGLAWHIATAAIAGLNATPFVTEYSGSVSVTGTGDAGAVQSVPGATGGGNRTFSSTGSQAWASIALEVQKAP